MATEFPMFLKIEHRRNPAAQASAAAEAGNIASVSSRAFAEFKTSANRSIDSVEDRFASFSSEAERMISRVVRNDLTGGKLNLGVQDLQLEAQELELKAAAARELAVATELAARAEGDHSRTARLQIAAMQAAANEASEAATTARGYAAAQQQVQNALRETNVDLDAVTAATGRHRIANDNAASSAGATRAGMQQLSYQLGDVATMWSLGAKPMQIFASQSGQVVQALQLMNGSARGFAGFLAGPWGLVLTSAITILGTLGTQMLMSGDAADDASKSVEDHTEALRGQARETENSRIAQDAYGRTLEGVTEAIEAQRRALDELDDSHKSAARSAMELAVSNVNRIESQKGVVQGLLAEAEAQQELNRQRLGDPTQNQTEVIGELTTGGPQNIARIRREIEGIEATLGDAQKNLNRAYSDRLTEIASFSQDEKINDRYDRMVRDAQRAAEASGEVGNALFREVQAINAAREAELERAQASGRGSSTSSSRGDRAGASRLSDAAKAYQQATDAAEDYIETLDREIEAIGASAGQLRQLEVARAKASAPTDDLRAQIEARNALREEAITEQERLEAARQAARASADFEAGTLQALRDELALLGLVGPARQRAALALEENAMKADLAERGIDDVNEAWEEYARLTTDLINRESVLEREAQHAEILANEIDRLSGALQGLGGAAGAVGGLFDFVNGRSLSGPLGALLGTTVGTRTGDDGELIAQTLGDELRDVFGADGAFGETLSKVIGGAGTGILAGTALFGRQDTVGQLSSALGGAAGQAAGEALTEGLSGILGVVGGPLGSIIGGVAGGLFGGLFSSKPYGTALLTGSGAINSSGKQSDIASGLGGSVQDGLQQIANQLGGEIGSYLVSIGTYNDSFRVSTTGFSGSKLNFKGSSANGLYSFASEEDAIRFALADAISDGAIKGISDAEQRLLRAGQDIETALGDVLTFRSVFDRLAQIRDPLRFEIDQLNDEFENLIGLFDRAGASAQQYADLEELYGLERAQIIEEAGERVTGALQDLLDDLNFGDSGLSARDRRSNILGEYGELADRVRSGDTTAYDDYAETARELLAIERELFGSQQQYFDRIAEVSALSQGAVDEQQRLIDGATGRDSPFGPSTEPNRDAGIIASIDGGNATIVDRLEAVIDQLGAANRQLSNIGGSGGGIIDSGTFREFANAF